MKRLVVQLNTIGGWDVREDHAEGELLYSSDRIRAEGHARQLCAAEGGSISVVGHAGMPLAEYVVKPWSRAPGPDAREERVTGGLWGRRR